jgi:Glycosyl transferase family 2
VTQSLALLSAQKNEGPFMMEFVAHHFAVGFKDIFIVTNPSDDGSCELATALFEAGYIRHLHVETPPGKSPQDHAFSAAREYFGLNRFEWLMILDADELLNIHVGDGSINYLLSTFSDSTDIVSINTACFGSHPHTLWSPLSSAEQFLFRLESGRWRNSVSKSLVHFPVNFRTLRPHGPKDFLPKRRMKIALHAGLRQYGASSDDPTIYGVLRRPGSFAEVHRIAQINHYVVRTWDCFQLRMERGRGAVPRRDRNDRHTAEYFESFSKARFFDDSIGRYSEKVKLIRDSMLESRGVRAAQEFVGRRFSEKLALLKLPS